MWALALALAALLFVLPWMMGERSTTSLFPQSILPKYPWRDDGWVLWICLTLNKGTEVARPQSPGEVKGGRV